MIAIKLAGYTWLEADKLRKAMGKKIPEEMDEQKEKLIEGLIRNGMANSPRKADQHLEADRAFRRLRLQQSPCRQLRPRRLSDGIYEGKFPGRSTCPRVLTADSGDVEKIGEIVTECKRMGIPVCRLMSMKASKDSLR